MRASMFFVVGVVILFICLPAVDAAPAAPPCITYAYTDDGQASHYSLLRNHSSMIGQNLQVESDCGGWIDIYVDGTPYMGGEGPFFTAMLPEGNSNVTIISGNYTYHFEDVTFYSDSSDLYGDYYDDDSDPEKKYTTGDVWWGEILAHGVTFLIVYVMSTTVVAMIAIRRADMALEVVV